MCCGQAIWYGNALPEHERLLRGSVVHRTQEPRMRAPQASTGRNAAASRLSFCFVRGYPA